jgi:hypothetical protein
VGQGKILGQICRTGGRKMNRYLKVGLFGFFIWLIPFVVSVLIFPLRAMQRPLFESIMPVVIAIWTVFFAVIYLLGIKSGFQKEGIVIGMAWFFISIFLDLLVFIEGPIKMSLWDYATDIPLTYLMIPTITFGFGYLMEKYSSRSG